jgi:GTP-binding protein YchF
MPRRTARGIRPAAATDDEATGGHDYRREANARCPWGDGCPHDRSPGAAVSGAAPVDWAPVALTIGIVGLPNVGKSTLFNALTKNQVLAANYPFATIEPNVGVVNLPDPRLEQLASIFGSERILPAAVSFVDIAGIVRGASEGEGLGNKFLANIREADAIAQVVRGFEDGDVVHVDGKVDPKSDMETINTELILADLETLERAITRYEKEVKGKKLDPSVLAVAKEAQEALQAGTPLSATKIDLEPVKELGLLTAKPFIYVFNVDEGVLTDASKKASLAELVAPAEAVFLDAKIESELIDLDPEEAAELLASTGQDESGLDQLARVGFDTLGLQTYLTAGPKESRAWTIRKGWKAPQAAGVIHTDFERGFIKAEVISFADLVETGSVAEARAKGKARMEGKDYVMQDGDVVEFRFNV